jgi:RNA polymerase sigma factor (sigma-70 family)
MEEVSAEAFAAGWCANNEYQPDAQHTLFQAVYQKALNACLRRYRQEWRYAVYCPVTVDLCETREVYPSDLYAALYSLPEADRLLLHQLYWEGYTETEIAQQRGVSVQAVSKRKRAALQKLHEILSVTG